MSHVAIVYEFCLTGIDNESNLFGMAYIGQAVRSLTKFSSAEALLQRRAYEHEKASEYAPKDVGFRKAIAMFGMAAFQARVLESQICNEPEGRRWANEVEIKAIADRGGILKNMYPMTRIDQTFNLVSGGTGNAEHAWARVQALMEKRWSTFKTRILEYVDAKGHACPMAREKHNGFSIGKHVSHVRTGMYLGDHHDRRCFLEALPGWKWKVPIEEVARKAKEVYDGIAPTHRFNSSRYMTAETSSKNASTKRSIAEAKFKEKLANATTAEEAARLQKAFAKLCKASDARRNRMLNGVKTTPEQAREAQRATWKAKRLEKRAKMSCSEQIVFDKKCAARDRARAKRVRTE